MGCSVGRAAPSRELLLGISLEVTSTLGLAMSAIVLWSLWSCALTLCHPGRSDSAFLSSRTATVSIVLLALGRWSFSFGWITTMLKMHRHFFFFPTIVKPFAFFMLCIFFVCLFYDSISFVLFFFSSFGHSYQHTFMCLRIYTHLNNS